MSNPRLLTTELIRRPDGKIDDVILRVAGWRIDFTLPGDNAEPPMINIANEKLDGVGTAGWCACAYDGTVPDADLEDLTLNGGERE